MNNFTFSHNGKKYENFGCFEYLELHLRICSLSQLLISKISQPYINLVFTPDYRPLIILDLLSPFGY